MTIALVPLLLGDRDSGRGYATPSEQLHVQLVRGGHTQLFLSPQSQFRNLKKALPQLQFHNFFKKCCSATATPQFRNHNFF